MPQLHTETVVPFGYHLVGDEVATFPGLCWDCGEAAEPHEALCEHCLYEAANADEEYLDPWVEAETAYNGPEAMAY